jgi:hypothetical protein
VIVGGTIALDATNATNSDGQADMAALDNEMKPAAAILLVGLSQIQYLVMSDPDGSKAYLREITRMAPSTAPPPPPAKKKH